MRENKCFDMKGRDIFLRPLVISSCEIVQTVRQPMVLLFAGLLVLTLVIFDAAHLQAYMSWWQALLIWVIAVTIQILGYTSLSLIWAWFQARNRAPLVFLPLVSICAFLITYLTTAMLVEWTTGRTWEQIFVPGILFVGLVFALIGEALYFAFVLPQILEGIRDAGPSETPRHIAIAGEKFDIDSVLTLRGQEHCVLIETRDKTHKLRGRLCDLVSQTKPADGILAHRSYWVSGRAITRLEQQDGNDAIITVQGERLKVAQPRRVEVRSWVAQNVPHATENAPP